MAVTEETVGCKSRKNNIRDFVSPFFMCIFIPAARDDSPCSYVEPTLGVGERVAVVAAEVAVVAAGCRAESTTSGALLI